MKCILCSYSHVKVALRIYSGPHLIDPEVLKFIARTMLNDLTNRTFGLTLSAAVNLSTVGQVMAIESLWPWPDLPQSKGVSLP